MKLSFNLTIYIIKLNDNFINIIKLNYINLYTCFVMITSPFDEENPQKIFINQLPLEYRLQTIQKIFTLLTIQLTCTFGIIYGMTYAKDFVLNNPGIAYGCIALSFVFMFLSFCYGQYHPHGLWILGGFTLSESYAVGAGCVLYDRKSILVCAILSISTFIILSLYVWRSKTDFNFLGAAASSALWVLCIGSILKLIFFPNDIFINTIFAMLGIIVAISYILYDVSDILYRLGPDEVVYACLSVYLDILILFTNLLQLLGKKD